MRGGVQHVSVGGLSPRVRGNHGQLVKRVLFVRSIPASAGQPGIIQLWRKNTGVYPRECGATRYAFRQSLPARGLSPRVRGNRPESRPCPLPTRSIPASAGQPLFPVSNEQSGSVYPRECGATDSRYKF